MRTYSIKYLWNILLVVSAVTLVIYITVFCCFGKKDKRIAHDGEYNVGSDETCRGNGLKTFVAENCSGKFCFKYLTNCALKHITLHHKDECKSKKFLTYKCDKCCCGGLGDRIKGITSSFLLAIVTKRVFVIDMKQPCDLENILDYRVYDWSMCKSFTRSLSETKLVSITKDKDSLVPNISDMDFDQAWYETNIETAIRIYAFDVLKNHKYTSKHFGWMKNMSNEEITHLLINTLFKEGYTLLKSKEQLLTKFGDNKKLVCAHIRMGKNPSNPQDRMVSNGIGRRQLKEIFTFLESFALDKQYSLYMASDSDHIKQLARKIHTMHTLNSSIVHIDLPVQDRFSFEVCNGLFTVLLEYYFLASCDILLLTRSNFGVTAAYMRGSNQGLFIVSHQNNIYKNGIIKVNLTDIQIAFGFS